MQILDLSLKPRIGGAKYWNAEINQLYHPTGTFGQDSKDIIYTRDSVSATKFLPVLLKEWFYLLKKDGYLVIDYRADKFCDFQKLEENMWWLWKGQYDITYHGSISPSNLNNLTGQKVNDFAKNPPSQPMMPKPTAGYFRFICKKLVTTKKEGDDINKWTFGIITKGERDDWLEEIITSIKNQKIPNYEIIVCGTYRERGEKNFKYIPFFGRDDKGWITKKKNLIAKNAEYENVCIIHDRIVFDKDWFPGMKKYGNCFDVLCNSQTLKGVGMRTGDWLTYGSNTLNSPYGISQLNYSDWDEYVYMGGQLSIFKKSVWEKCHWNETLYWGEEDVELSFRFRDSGFLIRFNPYSTCTALAWRFGIIPTKHYFSESLFPKDMKVRRFLRFLNKLLFTIPLLKKITFHMVGGLMRSRFYSIIIRR